MEGSANRASMKDEEKKNKQGVGQDKAREDSGEIPKKGHPLAIDPHAVSACPGAPAFIAKPDGAPDYYGFQVLEDTEVEGFRFGKITDFDAEPVMEGEGFVVAPDDSRAGLIWHVSEDAAEEDLSMKLFSPPESGRWGVWEVSLPNPMTNHENVRKNLELLVPALKEKWNEWRQQGTQEK